MFSSDYWINEISLVWLQTKDGTKYEMDFNFRNRNSELLKISEFSESKEFLIFPSNPCCKLSAQMVKKTKKNYHINTN